MAINQFKYTRLFLGIACVVLAGMGSYAFLAFNSNRPMRVDIYETSVNGGNLAQIRPLEKQSTGKTAIITLDQENSYQTILGFGGSFTQATSHLLFKMSEQNRKEVIEAYFGINGANYSLARTHIGSCDFSTHHYTYANVADDMELKHFTIDEDKKALIPAILEAQKVSKEGFKILSSPWTCPPWMKDNKDWVGGKLLPKYMDCFALYFSKYLEAYKKEGIDIWGLTPINEPHGNGNNWESTLFSPSEMTEFVSGHMGPILEQHGFGNVKILGYDQNRAGIKEWVDDMYKDTKSSKYFDGLAIHWYESTYEVFPKELQYAHSKAPDKMLLQTEACIDAEVPVWKDDKWYWEENATDWGWDWAPADQKYLHPKYAPVNRYAVDIIGCLNNRVEGWIDWNMVLNRQGGPNWFKNWCIAPVIYDEDKDEVYYTPLYYVMAHFSKYIRPRAKRILSTCSDNNLHLTAAINPDMSIAIVVFNPTKEALDYKIDLKGNIAYGNIKAQAIQTITLKM